MKTRRTILYFILVIFFALFNFYLRPVSGNSLVTKEYKSSSSYINDLYYSDEHFKKGILEKDEYYLYDRVIEDVKSGKYESEITCKKKDCSSTFYKALEAVMLDHPEFLAYESLLYYDYKSYLVVHYTGKSPTTATLGARRIEREIDIIKRETKKMSDKEKIIYVYNYVASHNYDRLFTYTSSNQSAYSFFTKGTSVCAGFAKASQIIFQNIGIKSYLVVGYDHLWNYVEYEGKYYIFDATVGTSYYNKKHPNYYEGLARTTVNQTVGDYSELYPAVEKETLKELFGL